MKRVLNLDDIQGNIPRAYGRYSFPFARYFFLHIEDGGTRAARELVDELRARVTTAAPWSDATKPKVTLNVAFTFFGLHMLGLPTRTLQGMPESFVDGMKARAFILGDRDPTKTQQDDQEWCANWDPIWRDNKASKGEDVHIWVGMSAQGAADGVAEPTPELEEQTQWLRDLCAAYGGMVKILTSNGRDGTAEYQSANAIFRDINGTKIPTAREHFGFTDGIGDPVFEGQYPPEKEKSVVIGRGKWMNAKDGWQPLATGEFILGYPDESQELPPTAMPPNLMHNGSFMVYRKLHQNVGSFHSVVNQEAEQYASVMGIDPTEAIETLRAKMIGRWSDGIPLSTVPDFDAWQKLRSELGLDDPDPMKALQAHRKYLASTAASDFRFADDMHGYKCPVGAHMRRANTRDYLDPLNQPGDANPTATTQLNKRRRILRRGLPYGGHEWDEKTDDTDQGVALIVIGTSIFRQFEFVQQQWIQYGLDFNQGNHTCPVLGNHEHHKRFVISASPDSGKPPYVMNKLKTFVETRGGDYFFLPSLTALHMIATGIVDPT